MRWMLVLGLLLGGCTKKLELGESCYEDDECLTGYCECGSECRAGCCAQRVVNLAYEACTTDCVDLECPGA